MKYNTWLDKWLENYVKTSTKIRTYERYKEIVEQHLKKKFINVNLNELKPIDIQQYIQELLQRGNLLTGQGLSTNSVNAIITIITSSLKSAYAMGYVKKYFGDKIMRPKIQEKEVSCFSLKEQKSIEERILRKQQYKLYGVILCLYTGIRIGELLALEWKDIDLEQQIIYINKTCYYGKNEYGKYARLISAPKTKFSKRIIPIPDKLIRVLIEIKNHTHSTTIISNTKGEGVSVRSYQKSFEILLRRLKIQHRGFHALRHTFATRALECGMDVKTLSEILGHKNPVITLNRYAHSMLDHKKEMMNKLGDIFKKETC